MRHRIEAPDQLQTPLSHRVRTMQRFVTTQGQCVACYMVCVLTPSMFIHPRQTSEIEADKSKHFPHLTHKRKHLQALNHFILMLNTSYERRVQRSLWGSISSHNLPGN